MPIQNPERWLKPCTVNPWHPFVTDKQALQILEEEIVLLRHDEEGRPRGR